MKYLLALIFSFFILHSSFLTAPALAIVDPLKSPNNKFGIHIISASPEEINPAVELVNSNGGDWGYITVLIESKNRDQNKWQQVFDILREKHLIPLVRLATISEGGYWKRPYEGEEIAWADFLNNLNWPTKNRYIIIYNEPNHATEWGNQIDPKDYARTLSKTIDALKEKSEDFFVLNAGFDASAPSKLPSFQDQAAFMQEMDGEVPGIFNKLDGFASHSYPNPGFTGSPDGYGRGTVRGWMWEMQFLRILGLTKDLPIFITETGWKHSDGIKKDLSLPSPEKVATYLQNSFQNAWNDSTIIAVTPFLLNYQDPPFDHFSFKRIAEGNPEYHSHFLALKEMPKSAGLPVQEHRGKLSKGGIYSSIVAGENYVINLTIQNTGESIWNEYEQIRLVSPEGGKELGIEESLLPKDKRIKPGGEHTFSVKLKAPQDGKYHIVLNLFAGNKPFLNAPFEFDSEVKSPVSLKIKSALLWKNNFAGKYLLSIAGAAGNTIQQITLDEKGESEEFEARYLPPDMTYNFTLEKPYYKPKTLILNVNSGLNTLDFGTLTPDIASALLKPSALWHLLPFTR